MKRGYPYTSGNLNFGYEYDYEPKSSKGGSESVGPRGPQGKDGPQGATGPQGPVGPQDSRDLKDQQEAPEDPKGLVGNMGVRAYLEKKVIRG